MILVALHHPSEAMGRMLGAIPWQDTRCLAVWEAIRTKLTAGTLHISEMLAGLTEDVREWLTPLAIQERRYDEPLGMLADLAASWQRQKDVLEWQDLKAGNRLDDRGQDPAWTPEGPDLQRFVKTFERFQIRAQQFEGGSAPWLNKVNVAETPKSKETLLDPIKKLIDQGKEAGFLTYEEINRRLPEGVIGGEELDDLFGTLEDLGIEVVDREEDLLRPSEKPAEEEVPLPDLGVETTNSIRMYLTEMGKVPLLTREQELTLDAQHQGK